MVLEHKLITMESLKIGKRMDNQKGRPMIIKSSLELSLR